MKSCFAGTPGAVCKTTVADEMRDWWKEKDYLDLIKETTITEEKSKDEIVNEIYSTVVR